MHRDGFWLLDSKQQTFANRLLVIYEFTDPKERVKSWPAPFVDNSLPACFLTVFVLFTHTTTNFQL